MRRLLAISGKRFSGKDTLAALLAAAASRRGVELVPYAFAAESKRMFAARDASIDLSRLTSDRDYKETLRPQLTRFTEESLAADPLVFVREVARRIEADPRPALITDLRLRLELDWLRPRFDLTVARIQRADVEREKSGWRFDPRKDAHRTETELDEPSLWDVIVENQGSQAELAEKAETLLSRLVP
jgi:phosphomevalonate kinase